MTRLGFRVSVTHRVSDRTRPRPRASIPDSVTHGRIPGMAKPTKAELHAALREYMRKIAARGGRKGGPARAKKLSAEERRASASKAARARWAKRKASEKARRAKKRAK